MTPIPTDNRSSNIHTLLTMEASFLTDNVARLQQLLAAGFEVNTVETFINTNRFYDPTDQRDKVYPQPYSLLRYAVENKAIKCLRELIKQGVNPNRSDTVESKGGSALQYMLLLHSANNPERNYQECIEAILQVPVDTGLQNMYQETIFDSLDAILDQGVKKSVYLNIFSQQKTAQEWHKPLSIVVQKSLRYGQTQWIDLATDTLRDTESLKQLQFILDLCLSTQLSKANLYKNSQERLAYKIKALDEQSLLQAAIETKDSLEEDKKNNLGSVYKI